MEQSNKAKQIVHEAEITRQHARYKIPATIEIEGKIYKVHDWSVSGIAVENLDEEIYKKKFVVGKMYFKFDDFITVIDNLHIEFLSMRSGNIAGGRFTELTPQQIAIFNQIISAYLAGDIVTEDDIIHAVTRSRFNEKVKKKVEVDKKKSIGILLLIWTVLLFLLGFILFVLYQRLYIVRAQNAFFDANLTVVRAPAPTYINYPAPLKRNQYIQEGDKLFVAHMLYGGILTVKAPVSGYVCKVSVQNGDFRNVGEPVLSLLPDKNEIFVEATLFYKDMEKIRIGNIAKVTTTEGVTFDARIVRVRFPYEINAQHSKPLENIYNQPRNYVRVTLKPINYTPSIQELGASVVVTIDTFFQSDPQEEVVKEATPPIKAETKAHKEKNKSTEKTAEIDNNTETEMQSLIEEMAKESQAQLPPQEPTKKETTPAPQARSTQEQTTPLPQTATSTEAATSSKSVQKGYCIIAASSQKPFADNKSKRFMEAFGAKIERYNNIYELKVGIFATYSEAKQTLSQIKKEWYKDPFIIKCEE